MRGREDQRFTGPQIRYWLISLGLIFGGAAAEIWGDELPWQWLRLIAKELGPGIFTAGIIASLVEPFFRKEFARDAFLAAFRYVLPSEFREEVEKILRFDLIAEKQLWTVKIEKVSDEMVLVTTTFDRLIKSKDKIQQTGESVL
jgi:MFS family permease